MKPPGIAMEIGSGGLRMFVRAPSHVEDEIWRAVQDAIAAGVTPEQFKREVAAAWEYELGEEAKRAGKVLRA